MDTKKGRSCFLRPGRHDVADRYWDGAGKGIHRPGLYL